MLVKWITQKYYLSLIGLSMLVLCLFNHSLFAKINNPEEFDVFFKVGECNLNSGYFETLNDGQLYINKFSEIKNPNDTTSNNPEITSDSIAVETVKNDFELRLKQNTIVQISKNPLALTDELELEKGIIGLRVASDTLLIRTNFADIRLRNATVTIRKTDNLIRLCVIKGTAIFIKKANFISVEEGHEIAASKDKLSQIYKFLDDLRYVWYWKAPSEEPSLRE